jgi:hypothetical protein
VIVKTFEEIHNQYPSLFIHSADDTFKCGVGWARIIFEMCAAISSCSLVEDIKNFKIISINNLHGTLSIEYESGSETVFEIIRFTEKMSYKLCENCGTKAELYCDSKFLHWSYKKTLCTKHALKLYYYSIPNNKGK